MAKVLCTGVDPMLLKTRRLILEFAGHTVTTAGSEQAVAEACRRESFEVAVIGQTMAREHKHRILTLLRQHCPDARVLELYSPSTGPLLPDADDWLIVPVASPPELSDRVTQLARHDRRRAS